MRWNDILEHAIVGKLVETLIDEGYRVELSDQDAGGLFCYAWQDERPSAGKFTRWVRLVPGFGADVIADFTTNLEATLDEVNKFAAQYA